MTTRIHSLSSPSILSQTMATRRTARGHHAQALATLSTDAATGHPGQRATVLQNSGGEFQAFYHPDTTARVLEVAVTVSWNGSWSPPDAVTLTLSVTDGTTNIPYTDPTISAGLRGEPLSPGLAGGRLDSFRRVVCHLDKYALITAGLSATLPWTFTFLVTCGASCYCEAIELSEVSRFTTDTAETYGDLPEFYLGRSIIDTHISRLEPTLSAAYFKNRRTYQSLCLDKTTPDVVTSAVLAAIPGSQDGGAGSSKSWKIRPRVILGEPQILWGVRYLTTGANDGEVELATNGTGSPYTMTLPGTSNTWTDAFATSSLGFLANGSADTLQWRASISGGDSLKINHYWVCDDPA